MILKLLSNVFQITDFTFACRLMSQKSIHTFETAIAGKQFLLCFGGNMSRSPSVADKRYYRHRFAVGGLAPYLKLPSSENTSDFHQIYLFSQTIRTKLFWSNPSIHLTNLLQIAIFVAATKFKIWLSLHRTQTVPILGGQTQNVKSAQK